MFSALAVRLALLVMQRGERPDLLTPLCTYINSSLGLFPSLSTALHLTRHGALCVLLARAPAPPADDTLTARSSSPGPAAASPAPAPDRRPPSLLRSAMVGSSDACMPSPLAGGVTPMEGLFGGGAFSERRRGESSSSDGDDGELGGSDSVGSTGSDGESMPRGLDVAPKA